MVGVRDLGGGWHGLVGGWHFFAQFAVVGHLAQCRVVLLVANSHHGLVVHRDGGLDRHRSHGTGQQAAHARSDDGHVWHQRGHPPGACPALFDDDSLGLRLAIPPEKQSHCSQHHQNEGRAKQITSD